MSTFGRLHPAIQKAVYDMAWTNLRPLQVETIQAVFDTDNPLILSASTASGKTEAAFLPILSRLAEAPSNSLQAIYVSPLKALINDQFNRLDQLCEAADIQVHRWHGDVSASAKQRLREKPSGVLLITPESLESQFCNYDRFLIKMYHGLQFVVIDELHAFLDDVRGIHLRSLLSRLEQQANVQPRKIGLSATLGDFSVAQSFLNSSDPSSVTVLQEDAGERELRISVKSFYDSPGDKQHDDQTTNTGPPSGLAAVAEDIALRFKSDANLIFCNRRQDAEVLADKLHHIVEREHWPRDPFVLHHGSLSRDLREDAEERLKKGEPLTVLCTSTLEMGIDLGAVKSVGQVDPPWRVSSLVQRLGRSGRKEGQAQVLRMYALDAEPHEKSTIVDLLHPDLVRAVAMVELHREKWLEPPPAARKQYSTCVHQILSILKQTGGTKALLLHQRLCERGAFQRINAKEFSSLLRGLAANNIIEQTPEGTLILAPEGEVIVESRDFYAAFATSLDYSVENDGTKIGVLPGASIPPLGEHFLLAGRRWKVELIEHQSRRVIVSRARGWKRPFFSGGGGEVHGRVLAKMKEVLLGDGGFPYLDARAQERLVQARRVFQNAGLRSRNIVSTGTDIWWFTWHGSSVCKALLSCARGSGIAASWDGIAVHYQRVTNDLLRDHLKNLVRTDIRSVVLENLSESEVIRDRFDHLVPVELIRETHVDEQLDIEAVKLACLAEVGDSNEAVVAC